MNQDLQRTLFYEMLRIRRIEEAIGTHYKQQKMRCPIHLSIGQEAIAVGVCSQLRKEDGVFGNHRSHAHYLAKGGNFHKMIAELYGKKDGCTKGRGGSMHLIDLEAGFQGGSPLAAGSLPIAAGFAFAQQMQHSPAICAVFFGEAATEEGIFSETLNFAALKNLPLLFICENNQYMARPFAKERQVENRDRVKIAQAHGLKSLAGNGNDLRETYQLAKKAIDHVRSGKGPTFLELETYRLHEHIGRMNSDVEENQVTLEDHCPLKFYKQKLLEEQVLTNEEIDVMEAKITSEIDYSFLLAEESPFPIFDLDDEKAYAE
ncbi:MAG: thiamine pyrophosphate-dependent dehydrogenase E1 component subunit alpha [Simkania sp.]|nr:thiamine pyrophosphate-dependent dehydrogenase E1 component subunit alpha [Simkania sp.]MCP5490664.1 thiamine pyrophosphate-dependent dehydrogenase E1 component subunit alpha [Chlamydiales bacterium]